MYKYETDIDASVFPGFQGTFQLFIFKHFFFLNLN
jgi:hypothetical protein